MASGELLLFCSAWRLDIVPEEEVRMLPVSHPLSLGNRFLTACYVSASVCGMRRGGWFFLIDPTVDSFLSPFQSMVGDFLLYKTLPDYGICLFLSGHNSVVPGRCWRSIHSIVEAEFD
jgi:hypothetical protein